MSFINVTLIVTHITIQDYKVEYKNMMRKSGPESTVVGAELILKVSLEETHPKTKMKKKSSHC